MKKLWPTLLLVLILVAGYAYAKSEGFFQEEQEAGAPPLFTIPSEDIATLRVTGGAGDLELKRNGESWEMLKPAAYPVADYSAESLAAAFAGLTYSGIIEENAANLADFGLDKPVMEVEAVLKDGSTKKLLVGNALPVSGSTYVKPADAPTVYEMDDYTLRNVQKDVLELIDKSIFDIYYDKVKAVELEWKDTKWKLTKTEPDKRAFEAAWKLGDKELKPEEGSAVLGKLTYLATDRLPKAKSEVDWAGAEFKLTLTQEENGQDHVTVYTGKVDNELVRIAADSSSWAFAIPVDDIEELSKQGEK